MNASFTRKPTQAEVRLAKGVSSQAAQLVHGYASEVSDACGWPNRDNVENTKTHLLAYIAQLEARAK